MKSNVSRSASVTSVDGISLCANSSKSGMAAHGSTPVVFFWNRSAPPAVPDLPVAVPRLPSGQLLAGALPKGAFSLFWDLWGFQMPWTSRPSMAKGTSFPFFFFNKLHHFILRKFLRKFQATHHLHQTLMVTVSVRIFS